MTNLALGLAARLIATIIIVAIIIQNFFWQNAKKAEGEV